MFIIKNENHYYVGATETQWQTAEDFELREMVEANGKVINPFAETDTTNTWEDVLPESFTTELGAVLFRNGYLHEEPANENLLPDATLRIVNCDDFSHRSQEAWDNFWAEELVTLDGLIDGLREIHKRAVWNELPDYGPNEDVYVFLDKNARYRFYGTLKGGCFDSRNVPEDWEYVTKITPMSDDDIIEEINTSWESAEIEKRFATPEGKAEAIEECRECICDLFTDCVGLEKPDMFEIERLQEIWDAHPEWGNK